MNKRKRIYDYSSPWGLLPGARANYFIVLAFCLLIFLIGGILTGNEWFIVLPLIWMIAGSYLDVAVFFFRRFTLQLIARRLGLEFSRKGNTDWKPPSFSTPIFSFKTHNQIEGEFQGVPVVVFDSDVAWKSFRRDGSFGNRRGFAQRYFNIVKISAPTNLPTFLIGSKHDSIWESILIPGTTYSLHCQRKEDFTQVLKWISDEMVQFLNDFPKVVIQSDGNHLSVHSKSWMSSRYQTPGNLPAFMEDVIYLRSLLEPG